MVFNILAFCPLTSINSNMKILFYLLIIVIVCPTVIAQTTTTNDTCKKVKQELWRELADSNRYHEAINILLDSIIISRQDNKKGMYWHVGQLYAYNNEYSFAIEYLKKSTNCFDRIFDREWRLYYKGTIAFLEKDKKKLKRCNDKLCKKHSAYYSFNSLKLKALYDNFDKPYKLAYESAGQ